MIQNIIDIDNAFKITSITCQKYNDITFTININYANAIKNNDQKYEKEPDENFN